MDNIERIVAFNERAGHSREFRNITDPGVEAQREFLIEEYEEFLEAFDNLDRVEVVDALCDIIVVAAGMIHRLGYDPNQALDIVNSSNESKFVDTLKDGVRSVNTYANDERYTDVFVTEDGVVRGFKDGHDKILKGINYKAPDFSPLFAEEKNK